MSMKIFWRLALLILLCGGAPAARASEAGGVWKAGSPEARAAVVGRVVAVDRKYGYVVVDLNTGTRAVQKLGGREYRIDPKLAPGVELIVCREGPGGSSPVLFVARIRIRSIDERCTVADLPDSMRPIREGDLVIVAAPKGKGAE